MDVYIALDSITP